MLDANRARGPVLVQPRLVQVRYDALMKAGAPQPAVTGLSQCASQFCFITDIWWPACN